MKRLLVTAALPLLAALTACGPSNNLVLTNDNNVVLNDAQGNYASVNDHETPANGTGAASMPMNGTDDASAMDASNTAAQ
jgi:hypothetical protein